MLQTSKDTASSKKDLQEVRKKVLKAVLAPAILELLSEITVSSGTNLIAVLKKRYGIQLSAGTIYPVLYSLEKKKQITKIPHRIRCLYILTDEGKETIDNLQLNIKDLQNMVCRLLKN